MHKHTSLGVVHKHNTSGNMHITMSLGMLSSKIVVSVF